MPKVSIIDFTGAEGLDPVWYAARLMAFTKDTRLSMSPGSFKKAMEKPLDDLKNQLKYMSTTIPSSWEFIDVVFLFEDVSRATAQQITRTRTASFAMQSQRVTDMSNVTWDNPHDPECAEDFQRFETCMINAIDEYAFETGQGTSLEDARGLLPIGVHCNLLAKYNLRTIVELVHKRKSLRVQGPYRDIVVQMEALVTQQWPWTEDFFRPKNETAVELLNEVALELAEKGAMYKGPAGKIAKAVDLIK